jgi:hypothetical protein
MHLPTTRVPMPTMMCQPGLDDANLNRQRVPYNIVDNSRVQISSLSKKISLLKDEKLTHYLYAVVTVREDILKLDNNLQTNLQDTFSAVIDKELRNTSVIDRIKNNEQSTAVVSLFETMTVLDDQSMVKKHINRGRKQIPLQKVFYDFTSLKEELMWRLCQL